MTGTDTGVGKTTVACGIAAAFRRRGWTVGAFKPVETGCHRQPDAGPLPEDAARLKYFAGCSTDLRTICPYALGEPVAPLVAARQEGISIDIEVLVRCHGAIAAAHDVTLIEGAGGLLVPLAPGLVFADLVARLDVPLLVVVGSRLGAINHALLTIRYAHSVGLRVLGYVLNFLSPDADLAARTNLAVLTEFVGPALGVVPYLAEVGMTEDNRQRLADLFAAQVRLEALLVPPR